MTKDELHDTLDSVDIIGPHFPGETFSVLKGVKFVPGFPARPFRMLKEKCRRNSENTATAVSSWRRDSPAGRPARL